MTIRDTSAQDQRLDAGPASRRRWLMIAAAAAAIVLCAAFLLSSWRGGSRSFAIEKLRIAAVSRGDLIRDLSAEGKVIAANSPTLYAIAAGTITLNIVAAT